MAQGVLPFKYEEEKKDTGLTALAGLPIYLDLASVMGINESIEKHLHIKQQGWTDRQTLLSLVLMNLAGGDCVDDLRKLEGDAGFCKVLRHVEQRGMKRRERRELDRLWRKKRDRAVPSSSSVFRYLSAFHDPDQEKLRIEGKAFIPAPNEHLRGLVKVNADMVGFIQSHNHQKVATLDQDATLVETMKQDAFYSYKGHKAYQPFNTWWAEQGLVLHTEFRDGNVPAGYEQLRVLKETLALLPESVETVRLRSDTAGYQHDLLRYCEKGENERFGKIEFAIGCDVTPEFKKAVMEESDWQPIYKEFDGHRMKTNQEWAEVCFIPNAISHSKNAPVYRYLAIREVMGSMELPGIESPQQSFPFPTFQVSSQRYKLFGLVTNMDWDAEKLIHWHRERCGKSEEAHSVMKEDLAGGKLPSDDFGENAAWWWIMILAMNLNGSIKRLVLGKSWVPRRMKAIRFSFINIPGRIVERSRELIIRLVKGHPAMDLFLE
ncbi:MAG: IS1380 family transposase, partial [Syntrophales bacterium]|nr:IS1380 family transposase [Syntrophales bacterium]